MSFPFLLGVLMKIDCFKRKEISLVFFRNVSFHRSKNSVVDGPCGGQKKLVPILNGNTKRCGFALLVEVSL